MNKKMNEAVRNDDHEKFEKYFPAVEEDTFGGNTLNLAVFLGRKKMVKKLLGNCEYLKDDYGNNPLNIAAYLGRSVKMFSSFPVEKNNDGNGPLILASYNRKPKTVKKLVEFCSYEKNKHGDFPIDFARDKAYLKDKAYAEIVEIFENLFFKRLKDFEFSNLQKEFLKKLKI